MLSVPVAERTLELARGDFVANVKVFDYYVEFILYDIIRRNGDIPVLRRSDTEHEETEIASEAEIYMHGSVKWDGCSNWHFDEQERCMLHACEREELSRFGNAMLDCWDLASVLCPSFSC